MSVAHNQYTGRKKRNTFAITHMNGDQHGVRTTQHTHGDQVLYVFAFRVTAYCTAPACRCP